MQFIFLFIVIFCYLELIMLQACLVSFLGFIFLRNETVIEMTLQSGLV